MIEVLVISISTPLLIGIYKDKQLVEKYELDGKTSEELPVLFSKLLKSYDIKKIAYVNTPGSFMAIKVAYVFLKTICIVNKIEFVAAEGFIFNKNSPIKALGKKYFIKENNTIKVDFLQNNSIMHGFKLPKSIENINFNTETLPVYNLPAV